MYGRSGARGLEKLMFDERGFTTAGMALALLISLSLVFTGAQVYQLNTASAEVQDVADAAALSAENQVGEFMVIARFCDAVVLSLSLTSIAAMGFGVAALCTPATAGLSEGLLKAGGDLLKARDRFAERAASALNRLQEALPYYAAACAAGVSAANDGHTPGAAYRGVAVLVPSKGERISVSASDEAQQLLDEINGKADGIREKARQAEEAAQEANRSKERAFQRDCGDNPSYCMYERAAKLAGLAGADNPLYSSVDTWSFSVALARAKAYYRERLASEIPSGSLDEQARSVLRSHFYRFAVQEMQSAYVHESADSFEANFPHLPHNTAEMKRTALYADPVYPITDSSGKAVMHAWAGCPAAAGSVRLGSIQQMDEGDFETCPECSFTAASMGKVASASTSIDNGFEYHYEAVADEAANYERARKEADVPKSEVEDAAGSLMNKLGELLKNVAGKRIEPEPPGRFGAVAFVVNAGDTPVDARFANGFVGGGGSLGPRIAISAATLVGEKSDEGRTVLNSMLDGVKQGGGAAVGAAGFVLDAWSSLLLAYSNGQEAVTGAIRDGLNGLPLVGASGLGSWAADKLSSVIEDVGLKPTDLRSLKAVLVNSGHVAARDDGAFGSKYLAVKQRAISVSAGTVDLFSAVLSEAEKEAVKGVGNLGQSVTIASVELLGEGGPSIPITIPVPETVRSWGVSAIHALFDQMRSLHGEATGIRVWE